MQTLKDIKNFLVSKVLPNVNTLENDSIALKRVFNEYIELGLCKIRVPSNYGGVDLSPKAKIQLELAMGRWGGVFGFLESQFGTASRLIQKSANSLLKKEYLPKMATGNILLGNAISHFKPNSKVKLFGSSLSNGYQLNGFLPFVTGWQFYQKIVVGFYNDDNEEVFAIIPFASAPGLEIGSILKPINSFSANSVSMNFLDFFIPNEDILFSWKKGGFYGIYQKSIPYAHLLGIAQASLDCIENNIIATENDLLSRGLEKLHKQISICIENFFSHNNISASDDLFFQALTLSWKCINFAILISGGAGLLQQSRIQLLYKEVALWSIPRTDLSVLNLWVKKNI